MSVLVVIELLLVRYSGNGSLLPEPDNFELVSSKPRPILSGPPLKFLLPLRLNLLRL